NLVWNHQGTTGEPTTDLTLDVKGGFYSIALGDPALQGMADLPASLFSTHAGLKLRIWFNDGTNGLQPLGTDQALLVAPYALSLDQGSEQKIAGLEASLAQALARIATLEQSQSSGGSGGGTALIGSGNALGTLRNPYGWAGVPVRNAPPADYTVPAGKVLIVTELSSSDPIGNGDYLNKQGFGFMVTNGFGFAGEGTTLSGPFSGMLVDARPEISPLILTLNPAGGALSNSTSYTVPSGKYLVITSTAGSPLVNGIRVRVHEGGQVAFVQSGRIVEVTSSINGNRYGGFTGYLISPDNLAKLGRGGASAEGSGSTSPGGGSATSSSIFGSVNDLGNNWKQSTWFGTYLDSNSSWIYHDALGWVYPVNSGGNENWLYQSTLGWMWTNQSVYPYLYQNSNNGWIYLSNQLYYSSSSSSWINWGGGGPSAPIEDFNASKTYALGAMVLDGQNSYIMSGSGTSLGQSPASTPSVWSNLAVVATALGVPVESVPTLSTSTILNSLPGSAPSTAGLSAPTGATHVVDLNSSVNLEMIRVEPGTFTMGSPLSETGRTQAETEHNVTLTKPFYLGKYEVTQAQYEAVMTGDTNGLSATPSQFAGHPNRPVETVSWDDVQVFLTRLNAAEQTAGRLPAGWSYVLPTEAEWEYACRAGTTTAYFWGDTITPNNANYASNASSQTTNVGQYAANPWGFYDMHGNLTEWIADLYETYPSGPVSDPTGAAAGTHQPVMRGGSWSYSSHSLRSAARDSNPPHDRTPMVGFRLAFKQQ
ncbi:formylglycine-generating enzyme family protein, partial [Verrucomicrobia bacterium]|nr:formylglycine-generating enzyme family protein [Verrucomicrobiota bacterium]